MLLAAINTVVAIPNACNRERECAANIGSTANGICNTRLLIRAALTRVRSISVMGMPVKQTGPDYPVSEKGVLAEKPCRRDDRAVLQGLLDALTRLGAAVRAQQVDFFTARAGRHHHALGNTELHFPWLEVGDHHGQATIELGWVRICTLDPGEHVALLVADVEGQAQQLVGTFHGFGL